MNNLTEKISRRSFLGAAAATAAGVMLVKPEALRGAQAGSPLKMGILGCGGRGTAVGTGFVNNTNTRVVALADLFADQLEAGRKHFDELSRRKATRPSIPCKPSAAPRRTSRSRPRRNATSSSSPRRPTSIRCTWRPWWRRESTSIARSPWRWTCPARSTSCTLARGRRANSAWKWDSKSAWRRRTWSW